MLLEKLYLKRYVKKLNNAMLKDLYLKVKGNTMYPKPFRVAVAKETAKRGLLKTNG